MRGAGSCASSNENVCLTSSEYSEAIDEDMLRNSLLTCQGRKRRLISTFTTASFWRWCSWSSVEHSSNGLDLPGVRSSPDGPSPSILPLSRKDGQMQSV